LDHVSGKRTISTWLDGQFNGNRQQAASGGMTPSIWMVLAVAYTVNRQKSLRVGLSSALVPVKRS
jgi:hypothetical protein